MAVCEVEVDLSAVAHNVTALRSLRSAEVMAVVKADGYGHGLVPAARAALAGGASWLGVAAVPEALELRAAGVTAPILCWLLAPGGAVGEAVAAGVDVSVSARWALEEAVTAAHDRGRRARVHLKVDTGSGRGGAAARDWPELVQAAAKHAHDELEIVGVWSHLANAEVPDHPGTAEQLDAFAEALRAAAAAGVVPQLRHLANSAATLTQPETAFDLVRPGIAVYGVSPVHTSVELVPAMTLRAPVVATHRSGAYGARGPVAGAGTVVVVAAGYADGVPRLPIRRLPVLLGGRRCFVDAGVGMDELHIEAGEAVVTTGDPVVLFGPGDQGEPTVQEWAQAAGTIPNEILTRLGPRVRRVYR